MTLRNKNIGRQIIEIGSICLAAAGILAIAPQSASTQTRANCDRIYNGDISKLSVTKRLSYESNRREYAHANSSACCTSSVELIRSMNLILITS